MLMPPQLSQLPQQLPLQQKGQLPRGGVVAQWTTLPSPQQGAKQQGAKRPPDVDMVDLTGLPSSEDEGPSGDGGARAARAGDAAAKVVPHRPAGATAAGPAPPPAPPPRKRAALAAPAQTAVSAASAGAVPAPPPPPSLPHPPANATAQATPPPAGQAPLTPVQARAAADAVALLTKHFGGYAGMQAEAGSASLSGGPAQGHVECIDLTLEDAGAGGTAPAAAAPPFAGQLTAMAQDFARLLEPGNLVGLQPWAAAAAELMGAGPAQGMEAEAAAEAAQELGCTGLQRRQQQQQPVGKGACAGPLRQHGQGQGQGQAEDGPLLPPREAGRLLHVLQQVLDEQLAQGARAAQMAKGRRRAALLKALQQQGGPHARPKPAPPGDTGGGGCSSSGMCKGAVSSGAGVGSGAGGGGSLLARIAAGVGEPEAAVEAQLLRLVAPPSLRGSPQCPGGVRALIWQALPGHCQGSSGVRCGAPPPPARGASAGNAAFTAALSRLGEKGSEPGAAAQGAGAGLAAQPPRPPPLPTGLRHWRVALSHVIEPVTAPLFSRVLDDFKARAQAQGVLDQPFLLVAEQLRGQQGGQAETLACVTLMEEDPLPAGHGKRLQQIEKQLSELDQRQATKMNKLQTDKMKKLQAEKERLERTEEQACADATDSLCSHLERKLAKSVARDLGKNRKEVTLREVIENLPESLPIKKRNVQEHTVGDDDARLGLRGGRGLMACQRLQKNTVLGPYAGLQALDCSTAWQKWERRHHVHVLHDMVQALQPLALQPQAAAPAAVAAAGLGRQGSLQGASTERESWSANWDALVAELYVLLLQKQGLAERLMPVLHKVACGCTASGNGVPAAAAAAAAAAAGLSRAGSSTTGAPLAAAAGLPAPGAAAEALAVLEAALQEELQAVFSVPDDLQGDADLLRERLKLAAAQRCLESNVYGADHKPNKAMVDAMRVELKGRTIDTVICTAAEPFGNATALINDPAVGTVDELASETRDADKANVKMMPFTVFGWPFLFMCVVKPVRAAEELRYSYGRAYWEMMSKCLKPKEDAEETVRGLVEAARKLKEQALALQLRELQLRELQLRLEEMARQRAGG